MAPKGTGNKGKRHPKAHVKDSTLLAEVLLALSALKRNDGCTSNEIIAQLKCMAKTSPQLGTIKGSRLISQVRLSLRHGVHAGLLRESDGKYVVIGHAPTAERATAHASRKNRRPYKRRRSPTKSESEASEETDDTRSTGDESVGRSRGRRRPRRRPRRSRRSRKRRHSHDSSRASKSESGTKSTKKNSEPSKTKTSPDSKTDASQKQTERELPGISFTSRRSKRAKKSNRDLPYEQMDEDVISTNQRVGENEAGSKCGNPESLCSLKQDTEEIATELEQEPESDSEKPYDYIN